MAQQLPAMPQVPGVGQATGLDVANAEDVCRQRLMQGGLTRQEIGEDRVRVWEITAEAATQANIPGNQQQGIMQALQQMQAQLAQIQAGQAQILARLAQGQAQMQAQLSNLPRRMQNASAAQHYPRGVLPLAALAKEQPPPPGAANVAAVGALPPANVFPATWAEVTELTDAQLDQLSTFYGQPFNGAGVPGGRLAFMSFIKP